jgi:hypothetical protein
MHEKSVQYIKSTAPGKFYLLFHGDKCLTNLSEKYWGLLIPKFDLGCKVCGNDTAYVTL